MHSILSKTKHGLNDRAPLNNSAPLRGATHPSPPWIAHLSQCLEPAPFTPTPTGGHPAPPSTRGGFPPQKANTCVYTGVPPATLVQPLLHLPARSRRKGQFDPPPPKKRGGRTRGLSGRSGTYSHAPSASYS